MRARESKENEIKQPIECRRLDSIAFLMQGDEKYAAACFDGNQFLLATNKEKNPV